MDDEAALAEIRRAAEATLDVWPEAMAAVLFGSRARGNHRPDSDWDIAFIVKDDRDWDGGVPDGVPFSVPSVQRKNYVNEIAISEKLVARKTLCIGHVGRGIATDGMVLAGEWTRPKLEGRPFMEKERYKTSMGTSFDMVLAAVEAFARLGKDDWNHGLRSTDRFVACTADAAEHLARAGMGRHGLDAWHVHFLGDLAGQARQAGHDALAANFIRMNGATKTDHAARYKVATRESLAHAIARLPIVLELMRKELSDLPAGFLDLQERDRLVASAVGIFSDGAAMLRSAVSRDGADVQPPEPYEWLKPLARSRMALASKLNATADALRIGEKGAENDERRPPEPPPIDDPTDLSKM